MQSDAVGRVSSGPSNLSREVIPGFEITDVISEGPVYSAFKARQTALDRWVVLTLLTPEFSADAERAQGVFKEARKVARLKHPSLLQVFDLGQDGQRFYLVTEYVEGVSVGQLLKSIGKLPAPKACAIARAVAGALEFAWVRASLIHGGLTPGRVIVEQNQTKIAGLGLAGLFSAQCDGEGEGAYRPPDRGADERVTVADDIFALGLIWRELLTGLPTVPEEARGVSPTAGNPPPGVPAADWMMVRRMTAAHREHRYGKWTDVIRDFKALDENRSPAEMSGPADRPVSPSRGRVSGESPAAGASLAVRDAPARKAGAPPDVDGKSDKKPAAACPSASSRRGVGWAWGGVVTVWLILGWMLWRGPSGSGVDFTVRDLPLPGATLRVEKTAATVSPPDPGAGVPPPAGSAPVQPAAIASSPRVPADPRLKTEQAIRDMEDQVAAYLLREEYENAVAALDIVVEDSDDDELRRSARALRDMVGPVAELNTAVASALRSKAGETVTLQHRGKPVKGRLVAVDGGQIEIDEVVEQQAAIIKRHHSIALTEVDPADRAHWLGNGSSAVRRAMLFILAWRSRQPVEVLNRLAAQSGALAGAFQRRVDARSKTRSDAE